MCQGMLVMLFPHVVPRVNESVERPSPAADEGALFSAVCLQKHRHHPRNPSHGRRRDDHERAPHLIHLYQRLM